MAHPTPTPIQTAIPDDLERRISGLEYLSHTGPTDDLDDKKKRWLVVGICLHSILSALRKYVDPVVNNLYQALLLSDQIDIQTQTTHLRTYGAASHYLNYESINNNKTNHGYHKVLWDYKVYNAVDLSKLFLQTHMAQYTGFDGSCDSSALFGIINKIDKFPVNVQTAANDVSIYPNVSTTERIEDLIYFLRLDVTDEKETIEELEKWRKNGTSFLQGYTISFELVNEIRQKIQILLEYAEVISKTADKEFGKVHEALIVIEKTLSRCEERISTLENVSFSHTKPYVPRHFSGLNPKDFL
ncbi:unnamed protein product [Mytilus edulis]|uniref:Uncharacterized protein n=1 Tax=Mytilus edulis TaxID=6550 RepID=A0A8S3R1I0_MYTED|nr:unnamed protein product [Mytilus edulis]